MTGIINVEALVPIFNARYRIGQWSKDLKYLLNPAQLSVVQFIQQDLAPQSSAFDMTLLNRSANFVRPKLPNESCPAHNVASLMTRPVQWLHCSSMTLFKYFGYLKHRRAGFQAYVRPPNFKIS